MVYNSTVHGNWGTHKKKLDSHALLYLALLVIGGEVVEPHLHVLDGHHQLPQAK